MLPSEFNLDIAARRRKMSLNEGREFNRFTVSFPTTKLRDAAVAAVLAKNPAMNVIASTFGYGSEIGAIFLLRTPEGEQFPRISDLANVLDKHQGKTLKKEIIKAVAEHRKLMVAFPSASKRDAAIALAKDMNPDMGISVSTLWPGAGPATKGVVFILRNPDQKINRLEALVAKYEGKIVKNRIESALSEGRGPFRSPTNSFNDSWINIAPVGVGFFLFRVFGDFADAEIEKLPGVFGSKREARNAAEKIVATTGERIGSK